MDELADLSDSVRRAVDGMGLAAAEARAWPQVTELGWLLADVPEALGGLELGLSAVCAIQRQLGRRLVAVPHIAAALAMEAVCGSSLDDRGAWVERLSSGEFVSVPLTGSFLQQTAEGKLGGDISAAPSADKASHVLVCSDNLVALLPIYDVQLQARQTWDGTRRLFDIVLPTEGVVPAFVLASGEAARALQSRLASRLDFLLAADAVAGAAALLDMTVEYLRQRKQFGRPLAMFQALKHRCADLKTNVTAAEGLLFEGLGKHQTTDDEHVAIAAMAARQLACSVYAQMAEEAIQLHGGIGMTVEHHCHLFLKRAQLNTCLGWQENYELGIANHLLHTF